MKIFTFVTLGFAVSVAAVEPKFRAQEIDAKVGVGYGLQLADMDGDKKTDIVLCDKDKIVWYQNPNWVLGFRAESEVWDIFLQVMAKDVSSYVGEHPPRAQHGAAGAAGINKNVRP